jgi:uncharacterized DUF497 family protein
MMSRPLITELPACGASRGGNHPKTLRGPVGKERPAGPRSHIRERNALMSFPLLAKAAATSSCWLRKAPKKVLGPGYGQLKNTPVSYFVVRDGVPYWKVDWSHRREHVAEKGLTVEQANEALEDPEMLVIDPDPRSLTGDSVRIIGYSSTAQDVLTVVVVVHDGQAYGATAWRANKHERRLYRGGEQI